MREHFFYVTYSNEDDVAVDQGYFIVSGLDFEFPFKTVMDWARFAVGPNVLIRTWQRISEVEALEINHYLKTPILPETRRRAH